MMFTEKQIEFMESIGIRCDFSRLTDNDYCKIEEFVGDAYTEEAQMHPDVVTDKILMCESILDKLSEADE